MEKCIANVIPTGAPWGGPESVSLFSCFSSMLCAIEGPEAFEPLYCCQGPGPCTGCGRCGPFVRAEKLHEQVYHLYLTLSGLAHMTLWPRYPQEWDWTTGRLHKPWLYLDMDDAIARAMDFAGWQYTDTTTDSAAVIRASVDAGRPALVYGLDDENWIVAAGYDDGGVLDERGTRHALDAASVRVISVTGRKERRADFAEEFRYLAEALRGGDAATPDIATGWAAYDAVTVLLADDPFFERADDDTLERVYGTLHGFIGMLAENRCFAAMAMLEGLYGWQELDGLAKSVLAVAGGFFMETHDQCWKAWAALGGNHICEPEKYRRLLRDGAVRAAVLRFIGLLRKHDEIASLLLEEAANAPFLRPKN